MSVRLLLFFDIGIVCLSASRKFYNKQIVNFNELINNNDDDIDDSEWQPPSNQNHCPIKLFLSYPKIISIVCFYIVCFEKYYIL